MKNAARSLALVLLAASLVSADEAAKASAKGLESVIKAEFKARAPKKIMKLISQKKKPKIGKKGKKYEYNPRGLKKLWETTSPEFKKAFKLKGWTIEVAARKRWLGYPIAGEGGTIDKIVIHREFASVYWNAAFTEPTKGWKQKAQAANRLKKTVPLPRKAGCASSVWFRTGKTWTVGVRPTAEGKWEEANIKGDPLRSVIPDGFSADGLSAATVCMAISAAEDEVIRAKSGRPGLRKALKAIKGEFSGLVIWDVGILEKYRDSGTGRQGGRTLQVRVGHAIFEISDQSTGTSEHYAKLEIGTIVAFKGTYDSGNRSPESGRQLERTRAPFQINLRWPKTKMPAVVAVK
ncbi:MAG: hypothetical protein JKY65_31470 [Planctomycetes bacterium]|nr:hypothetical protein [Planctomycetota bacterium]